jgi:hypothetical protein
MRVIVFIAAAAALSGCALLRPYDAREARAVAPETPREAVAEPVAFVAASAATARGPVGLTPCRKGAFPARDCWRKGDQHILYPADLSTAALGGSTGRDAVTVSQGR